MSGIIESYMNKKKCTRLRMVNMFRKLWLNSIKRLLQQWVHWENGKVILYGQSLAVLLNTNDSLWRRYTRYYIYPSDESYICYLQFQLVVCNKGYFHYKMHALVALHFWKQSNDNYLAVESSWLTGCPMNLMALHVGIIGKVFSKIAVPRLC